MADNKKYCDLIEKKNENLVVFESLCYRAKEIIFNVMENHEIYDKLNDIKIPPKIPTLSPIEQIFFATFSAFNVFENECTCNRMSSR